MLDEKIVLCGMIFFCSAVILLLIHWHAEPSYVGIFGSAVTGLVGALLRGITHTTQQTDSTQSVQTTTTITPKEEVKP
jgi:hypothetical protein